MTELERAATAVAERRWADAHGIYRRADPDSLTGVDLERFADTVWWTSDEPASIEIRQRAYAAYAAEGDDLRAAWCAGLISIQRFLRGEPSVAAGWLRRAKRHVERQPLAPEHGFVAMVEGAVLLYGGSPQEGLPLLHEAIAIGERFRDRNLLAMAIHVRGLASIAAGRSVDGLGDLDEAMTSVVADELDPYFTGVIYCNVLEACLRLADLARATEWSDAAVAWCESLPPGSPFPGLCRVNRAKVANLRGRWADAEAEAIRAVDELAWDPPAAARASYEAGEIQRRRGDLAAAEGSFSRARELGLDPQPGLALLRLEQGKTDAAMTSLRIAADAVGGGLDAGRILAALVDVSLAAGDLGRARQARDRIGALAADEPTPAMRALTASADVAVALAEPDHDPGDALALARDAAARWHDLRMPYEAALARERLGIALGRAGDTDAAATERGAALSAFRELGATADATRVEVAVSGGAARPGNLTARELEVLRLVAAGRSNREIAAALVISEHTVARHLQNLFPKIGVASRSAATAFAFEQGLV